MSVPAGGPHESEEVETGRLEAFSDGVFAIAVTLLVLNLQVPTARVLGESHHTLLRALLDQWPSYLAYLLSFATILIMWINHHTIFKCVKRTNHLFLLLNGLLLLIVTIIPFPTALLAEYLQRPDAALAEQIYSGTYLVLAVVFNRLWAYAARGDRLIGKHADRRLVEAISAAFAYGPPLYLLAFLLAFVSAPVSLALCILLAIFYALPNRVTRAAQS